MLNNSNALVLRIDLDHDHYGLEKLKKRVIEYLAVRKLKNSLKGKIPVMKEDTKLCIHVSHYKQSKQNKHSFSNVPHSMLKNNTVN